MSLIIYILSHNILPLFALIGVGVLLSKKFHLDINTLTKINFYLFVPAFTFVNIYQTKIEIDALKAMAIAVLVLLINALLSFVVARVRHYDQGMRNAFQNSIMFYNSGNFGVPLITLVFSSGMYAAAGDNPYLNIALTTQIMVLVIQNVTVNTLGFYSAASSKLHWKEGVINILKMPTVYFVTLAFVLKAVPYDMTSLWIWPALIYAKNGLVPIALLTLGVQLSLTKFDFTSKKVYLAVFFRLIIGPVIAFGLIKLFAVEGVMAQALMISTGVPTAINSALIAVECDNHPDFASQVVLVSTLLCSVTLVAVIYAAAKLFPV